MALTPEQRALLELAHDRGLTYEEIGELAGIGAGEARRRVRAAEAASGRVPLLFVAALAGLALIAGVLAVAGVFSGDEEASSPPLAPEPTGDQEVARIQLTGAAGSGAEGAVAVGVGADNSPYLDLDLAGIEPSPGNGFHMLWIDVQRGRGVPLPEPIIVGADGTFHGRITLQPETAGILEVGRALEVVRTDRQAIARATRELTQAERASKPGELDPSDLPSRPGKAVLRGTITA